MSQILTCHNAHTEFLRQFWSAVLPTPPGTLGAPTPEQKMAKARKMAKFLSLMREKVDSVVLSAKRDTTVDAERVQEVCRVADEHLVDDAADDLEIRHLLPLFKPPRRRSLNLLR
jgi:pantoate kinase